MAVPDAAEAQLAELRTVVMRAREQALQITSTAQRARAELAAERERIHEERLRAERELRDDVRRGAVDPERRELAEKLVRGEVTWRDVMTGEEGESLRAEVGDRAEAVVEELRATDPAFRESHDAAMRAAADNRPDVP